MIEHKLIALSRGKFALVDAEDYDWLNQWSWCCTNFDYVMRGQYIGIVDGKKKINFYMMHRIIMNTPEHMQTDHINRNRLDNRRSNLRICTRSQNFMNRVSYTNSSSKYKGVSWHKIQKKWQANIGIDGKIRYLGVFNTEEDAALAYDKAAKELHKKFSNLNFRELENV